MKKTIVVIILAVYVASIAIVNLFGLEVRIFDGTTYVSNIQCDTVTFQGENSKVLYPVQYAGKDGDIPVFEFNFIPADENNPYTLENLDNNPNVVTINYELIPHLSDSKLNAVKFEYDEDAGVAVFHNFQDIMQSFVFLKPDVALTITIRAIDGYNTSTQIRIKGRTVSTGN